LQAIETACRLSDVPLSGEQQADDSVDRYATALLVRRLNDVDCLRDDESRLMKLAHGEFDPVADYAVRPGCEGSMEDVTHSVASVVLCIVPARDATLRQGSVERTLIDLRASRSLVLARMFIMHQVLGLLRARAIIAAAGQRIVAGRRRTRHMVPDWTVYDQAHRNRSDITVRVSPEGSA
jgi:hypothetical protein